MRPPPHRVDAPTSKSADQPRKPPFYQFQPKFGTDLSLKKIKIQSDVPALSTLKLSQQRPASAMSLPLRDVNAFKEKLNARGISALHFDKSTISAKPLKGFPLGQLGCDDAQRMGLTRRGVTVPNYDPKQRGILSSY